MAGGRFLRASRNFGPLTDLIVPRLVILGMTLLVIGLQMFFSAFLFGILGIPLRRNDLMSRIARTPLTRGD